LSEKTREDPAEMDCDTERQQPRAKASRRPILFRIEQPGSVSEADEQYCRTLAAGFDGVEVTLVPETIWWNWIEARTGDVHGRFGTDSRTDYAVCVVAARCTTTDVSAALDEVTSLIARAVPWRARCLNLAIPPLAVTPGDEGFSSYRDALNFAYKLLEGVRFEAEAAGVAVALEAGAGHTLLSPVELCEIIDAANSWAVGVCIDVATVARFGSPAEWIRTLARRIHAVRLQDVSARMVACPTCVVGPPGGHDALIGSAWTPDSAPTTQPKMPTAGQPSNVSAIADALDDVRYVGPMIAVGRARAEELRTQLAMLP
jgi:sugar phosphate isomerase/epimerase